MNELNSWIIQFTNELNEWVDQEEKPICKRQNEVDDDKAERS